VIEVAPARATDLAGLLDAFGGEGRPLGAIDCWPMNGSAGIVWDGNRSPVGLLLDLIEVETGGRRRITPIVPLDDRTLAAVGANVLRLPDLTEERFIETYLERLKEC
jgi:hypothetical protein